MISDLVYRLRVLFRRSSMETEMEQELREHLEHQVEKDVRAGMSRQEAERQAKLRLGGVEQIKEECRDSWGVTMISELRQDVRYGFRQLRHNPGFTAVAVITLALGIGVNTAVFSIVRSVLLSRLPYSDPDRLVCITESIPDLPSALANMVPIPDYLHWRNQSQVFETVAAYRLFGGAGGANLSGEGGLERIDAAEVSWDFFPMLGSRPASGRSFLPAEDRPRGAPVVVLSHALWQRRYRSDPKLLGKMITLDEKGYTVIGIMPESFRFPADWTPEVFVTTNLPPDMNWDAESFGAVQVMARLKPGVSLPRAKSDLTTINQRSDKLLKPPFSKDMHESNGVKVQIATLHDHLLGDVRPLLFILLGAVGFVLLLACANIANLQLARAAAREKEFAVRAAIGAGRWRLARQLLAESSSLAALGGLAGLILGSGGVALVRHLKPPNIPDLGTLRLDPWVFAFAAAAAAFAGITSGLAPIFAASRPDLEEALKESRPSTTAGGATQRLRSTLMVSEVALALVLLTGAGLLVRSFTRLASVDPGFDRHKLLTERVTLPLEKYGDASQWTNFFQSVLEHVGGLPGVESVAAVGVPPLTEAVEGSVQIEGRAAPAGTSFNSVSPSYFHTLRIPLITGRDFSAYDAGATSRVAIVNEIFARRNFGQESPLGHRFSIPGLASFSIIGVVPNTRHLPLTAEPSPEVYSCDASWSMTLIVRTASDSVSLAAAVRGKVQEVDPSQTVYDVATMEERFARAVAPQRFNAAVMAIFAGIAVVLAAVGVYGVMAYSVSRRTHEIGIRRALGAQREDVMGLVLRRGAVLALIGVTLGLGGALALTRFLSSLLYGVTVRDPLTFAAVSSLLAAIALVASYLPALRATKIDPMAALRHE